VKTHLIKRATIENYVQANARSRSSFEDFLEKLKYADWKKPTEMKDTFFGTGRNRVHLFICWIGTHADYTKLCKENLQYAISAY
jgi:mRNA interferase HigB